MDQSLLRLMEELLESIEQREAGHPGAPVWEAEIRIRQLEQELARRIAAAPSAAPALVAPRDAGLVRIA